MGSPPTLQETQELLVVGKDRGPTLLPRHGVPLAAAIAYGTASVVATLSNKALLSSWQFDCIFSLLLLQNALTALLLHLAAQTRYRQPLRLNFALDGESAFRLVAPVSVLSLLRAP